MKSQGSGYVFFNNCIEKNQNKTHFEGRFEFSRKFIWFGAAIFPLVCPDPSLSELTRVVFETRPICFQSMGLLLFALICRHLDGDYYDDDDILTACLNQMCMCVCVSGTSNSPICIYSWLQILEPSSWVICDKFNFWESAQNFNKLLCSTSVGNTQQR